MISRRAALAALLLAPFSPSAVSGREVQGGELTALSLSEAARLISAAALSPVDLAEAYLERIGQLDGELGAYVTLVPERARADARRAMDARPDSGGALRGIPIAHKDLFETAGIRSAAGSRLVASHVPLQDAAIVAALARAGTVLLGKTNTHELGGGVTTINPFYGTTRHPIDPSRIPGGSSGGSAAAVAARMALAATGSDTGGSVRIPAALCGCVGFKPTFGWLDTAGLIGACPTFDHVGLIARSAEDVELLYRALVGAPRPAPMAGPLRVGVARRFFFDRLEPPVASAMDRALDRFRAAGARVIDRDLPVDAQTMSAVFDPIVSWEIWSTYGSEWRARPEAFSKEFGAFFATPPPVVTAVQAAREARQRFQNEVALAFSSVDVVLTPTVPVTAPRIDGPIDEALLLRNTWPFNAARTPAISLPCGVDDANLPIGLQLAGRTGDDAAVLRAARLFEGA
jgi:aspartyl-tRNA(Asn)/glutamyl-tRNA(Gln) amidotransferase subunit A